MKEATRIGSLMQGLQTTRGEKDTRQLSTISSTEEIQQIFRSYRPSNQFAIVEQGDRAFVGASPTLVALKREMGYENLKALIAMQVMDLDDDSDVKDKLGGERAARLADKIFFVAFHLKASELMAFFWKFKCGEYGQFYGVVDSLKIMEALQSFMRWRNEKLAQISRRRQRERDLTDPKEIALTEWVRNWHKNSKEKAEAKRAAREVND